MIIKSKVQDCREWHRWFVWFPISFVIDDKKYFVWLTTIERRLKNVKIESPQQLIFYHRFGWPVEYRFINTETNSTGPR